MTDDWKLVTRDSYNRYAKDYALHAKGRFGKLHKWLDEFGVQFKKGDEILDLGCGSGRDALYFWEKGASVTGMDISSELIKIARKTAPHCEFLVMDFEEMDFPENSFDGAWASASLLHLKKDRILRVLKKVHKFLKPNGLFFLLMRTGEGERFTVERRGNADLKRFYVYYQPEELQKLLRKASFVNIRYELDNISSGDWVGFFAAKAKTR